MSDPYEPPPPTVPPAPTVVPPPYGGPPSQAPYPDNPYAAPTHYTTPYEYRAPGTGQSLPWSYGAPPPPPPPPPGQGPSGSRRGLIIGIAAVAVIVLIAALVNGARKNRNASQTATQLPSFSFSLSLPNPSASPDASPEPSAGTGPFGNDSDGSVIPSVFCPVIRDEKSHLSYRCIEDKLEQDGMDSYLGLRISLNELVEPQWVVSEGSGNPDTLSPLPVDPNAAAFVHPAAPAAPSAAPSGSASAPVRSATPADVRSTVMDRADRALQLAYGDNPTAKELSSATRTINGVQGYELSLEITINPTYRSKRIPPLKTAKERLWIVGLPTPAGVSVFMLSIPDLRKDLWPKAEDTIDTIKVI